MINSLRSWTHNLYKHLEIRDHKLSYLFLEITRRCNLSCRHCGSDCSPFAGTPELTAESWMRIIDYIHDTFGRGVTFIITGGEPLVHPQLETIAKHITGRGMRWGMVTNGMALTGERMDRLIDAGIYSITVSYDGSAQPHNYLRGSDHAHARAASAVELIAHSSVPMKDAVTCVFPGNIDELESIADFMCVSGMPAWRLFRIFPNGRAAANPELLMDHEQTWRMLNWIAANKKIYAKKGLAINASCEGWVPFAFDRQIRDMPFFCRAGINIAAILCDGTVTGCTNNSPDFYQGSVMKDSFSSLWENGFEVYRNRQWVSKTSCASCVHLKHCNGGSIHLWKGLDKKPEFCYMNGEAKAPGSPETKPRK